MHEQSSQRYPSNHDVNVTSTTPKLCMIRPNKTKMRDLSKTHPLWTKMLHQDETKISGTTTKFTTSGLLYRALIPIDLTAIGNYYIDIMQLNIFALWWKTLWFSFIIYRFCDLLIVLQILPNLVYLNAKFFIVIFCLLLKVWWGFLEKRFWQSHHGQAQSCNRRSRARSRSRHGNSCEKIKLQINQIKSRNRKSGSRSGPKRSDSRSKQKIQV